MNTKSLFQSKTFWINLLGGIVTAVGTYSDLIPAKYAPVIMCAGGIANILLRTITNQGVTVPGMGAGSLKMFVLVALLGAGVLVSSCATFKAHDPLRNPDGSLNGRRVVRLIAFGLEASCVPDQRTLPPQVCTYGLDAINAADAVATSDPVYFRKSVTSIFQHLVHDHPELLPWFDFGLKLLEAK